MLNSAIDTSSSAKLREAPPEKHPVVRFGDIFRVLRRRRRFILLAALSCALLTWGIAATLTERYATSAVLVFERSDTRLLEAVADFEREQVDLNVMETEMDVLKTRLFLGKVVDALDLTEDPTFNTFLAPPQGALARLRRFAVSLRNDPGSVFGVGPSNAANAEAGAPAVATQATPTMQRDRAISRLIETTTVDRSSQSLAVNIRVEHPDPVRAAEVANTIGKVYMTWSVDLKRRSAENSFEFYRTRSSRIEGRVAELESRIVAFTETNGVSLDERDDMLRAQISQTNDEIARVRIARAAALAELHRIETGVDGEAASMLTSPLLEAQRQEAGAIEQELADLAVAYGPRHPARLKLAAQADSTKAGIAAEIARLMEGRRHAISVAEDQLSRLEGALAGLERQRRDRALAEIRLREMESELAFERRRFEQVLESLSNLDRQDELLTASARFLSEASVPTEPYFPNIPVMVAGASIWAAAAAVILGLTLEGLDTRVRSEEQVAAALSVPTLAYVPRRRRSIFRRRRQPADMVLDDPGSSHAEALRVLWRRLAKGGREGDRVVVAVTSSLPDEGKGDLACGIAATSAAQGRSTALVGFGGNLPDALAIAVAPRDLLDYLKGSAALADVAARSPGVDVFVMADDSVEQSAIRTDSVIASLIAALRERYEFVVIAPPPLLASDLAAMVAGFADRTVLAVRWGATREDTLHDVASQIRNEPWRLFGAVLCEVDERRHASGRYGGQPQYWRAAGRKLSA